MKVLTIQTFIHIKNYQIQLNMEKNQNINKYHVNNPLQSNINSVVNHKKIICLPIIVSTIK
jgi:hypothetical protein